MGEDRMIINDLTMPSELAILAGNPGLTLDVTNLDPLRLPAFVKAALYTEATSFNVPQLQTSGDIDAGSASTFDAPQLQTSGDIDAGSASTFNAPQLKASGNIDAGSASTCSVSG